MQIKKIIEKFYTYFYASKMQKQIRLILIIMLIAVFKILNTPITQKSSLILIPFFQELSLGAQSYNEFLSKEKIY